MTGQLQDPGSTLIDSLAGQTLQELNVKRHGDLFYIAFGEARVQPQASKPSSIVIQDAVDDFLDNRMGLSSGTRIQSYWTMGQATELFSASDTLLFIPGMPVCRKNIRMRQSTRQTGTFGSKFVTCVISGNSEGNIDVFSYQVSNTCVGMVDADIIEPSVEPGIMRDAKPSFPVEYLLVNVTHGFPVNPSPMFNSSKDFPIENRDGAVIQSAESLHRYLESGKLADLASNFHFLLFMRSMGILNDVDEMTQLVRIGVLHNEEDVDKLTHTPGWQTLMTVLKESADGRE
ncbi:MAG: NPL4 family-domain-containing protein [Benniella sp.]|nr:MAG: NPL4 family-domain-containing protein [Benniella sp.]